MKRVVIPLVVVLVLGLALLTGLTGFGVRLFGYGLVWDEEQAEVYRLARGFLEDLQYKDFKKAASYHTAGDQGKVDIPELIEDLFKVKPEQLNIRDFRITQVDFDESRKRARTHFTATLELLNTAKKKKDEEGQNREREMEGILYWHKRPAVEAVKDASGDAVASAQAELPAGPDGETPELWFMKLESSLHDH